MMSFYGKIEYNNILKELSKKWVKTTYYPKSFSKIEPHLESFELYTFSTKDSKLKRTIALIQLARYINLVETKKIGSKAFMYEFHEILWVMDQVLGYERDINIQNTTTLKMHFHSFFPKRMLKGVNFLDIPPYYLGHLEPYDRWFSKDLKSTQERGFAFSEMWSLDTVIYNFLSLRLKEFKKHILSDDCHAVIKGGFIERINKSISFIESLVDGSFQNEAYKPGLTEKQREKNNKLYYNKLGKGWSELGLLLPELWD